MTDATMTRTAASDTTEIDRATVAALDLAFQAATKANDADTIDAILHPDFVLVLGDGTCVTRDKLVDDARHGVYTYEIQDETPGTQTVRVWGDTAVVTARLRIRGHQSGKPFDRTLWFSDVYLRTKKGWRYVFAQASLPFPSSAVW